VVPGVDCAQRGERAAADVAIDAEPDAVRLLRAGWSGGNRAGQKPGGQRDPGDGFARSPGGTPGVANRVAAVDDAVLLRAAGAVRAAAPGAGPGARVCHSGGAIAIGGTPGGGV